MVEPVSKSMTFGGSSAALYGYFTATEWCAVIGAMVAVIGLIVQWDQSRHKKRLAQIENDRAGEEHKIKMALLQKELGKYDEHKN